MQNPKDILAEYWGYPDFRKGQESIVNHILAGNDTIALLPTGGGKSICFQLPGIMHGGLTLVISPLISLIKDQVDGLNRRNISALGLHSGLGYKETRLLMDNALKGAYRFLYISPERLATEGFREYLPNLNIKMLVVDEAHCISQWGYDFRPAYLQIAESRALLPNVPIAAFTASAPPYVVNDIADKLLLVEPKITMGDFQRSNIHFHAQEQEDKQGVLLKMLSGTQGSSLVFARNRKETEELAAFLCHHGVDADFYHAGLQATERARKQDSWMRNQKRVMCCTNAFGMGVDKPDVRFVFHAGPPPSPEDYYQEAGRAGRDGKESWCVMLYRKADFEQIRVQIDARFPGAEVLARVYQALMAHLGIPEGGGLLQWYEFDPAEIAGRFRFQMAELLHALKSLELLRFFSLSEGALNPAAVHISADYASVYDFKLRNRGFEAAIDMLLRSHPGILDGYVVINESILSKRLRLEQDAFRELLRTLQNREILDYRPATDKPRVLLLEPRHSRPVFNVKSLEPLKKSRLQATEHMEQYVFCASCRSAWWIAYFTGKSADDCVKCDICAKRSKQKPQGYDFWKKEIKRKLISGSWEYMSFLDSFPAEKAEEMTTVFRSLLDNETITKDQEGILHWAG